ncbi:MAG: hypothetical protein ACYC4K_02895 [Thiobacillus sp.]
MAFIDPTTPNAADFYTFVTNQGVPTADLPSTSEYLTWALAYGQNIALLPPPLMPAIVYVMAVYNLGMHQLIKVAQDIPNYTFFTNARTQFGILSFMAGPIVASGDGQTSETLLSADWMKGMTLSALDLLKTPFGRSYLEYAQAYGPNIVGVS